MITYKDELFQDMLLHDGQKGMKWGRRRYRNYDGTLTPAGRERYGVGPAVQNVTRKLSRKERKAQKEIARKASVKAAEKAAKQATEESKRAAEEVRQAKEELRKEREDYEQKKASDAAGHATAEGNAQKKLDADLAKMNNDILRETNNRIKLEQEYKSLVHPKDNTQREGFIKRAAANVQNVKGIISNVNDIAKMVTDIKKAFKGDKESQLDLLKKTADIDKLKYDMETRDRSRKKWADDDAKAAADKASSEAKEKADRDSAARTANQEAADRWAAAQAERASAAYGSNSRSDSYDTLRRKNPDYPILALPPGRSEQINKEIRNKSVYTVVNSAKYDNVSDYVSSVKEKPLFSVYNAIKYKDTSQYGSKKKSSINHSENLDEFLEHHGILGMKWGVRRYQNKDGTLTAAGKKRFTNASHEKRDRLLQARKQELLKGKISYAAMSELAQNMLETDFTSKQINDIEKQYCYYLQSALQARNLEHVNEEMYQEKPEGITAVDFVRANNRLFEMNAERDKSFDRWQETFRKDYLDKIGLPKAELDKVGPLTEGVFREALEDHLNKTPLGSAQIRGAPKETAIEFAISERHLGDPNDRLYVSSDAYEIEEYENRHGNGSYQELIEHFKKG